MSSAPHEPLPAPEPLDPGPTETRQPPAVRLVIVLFIAFILAIPLLAVWALIYDRQSQSETAQTSIAEGWGDAQIVSGPLLVIPYRRTVTPPPQPVGQQPANGQQSAPQPTPQPTVEEAMLVLRPERAELTTALQPEVRSRAIYQAVVYQSQMQGQARFTLPAELLARQGIPPEALELNRAELRFGLSDPRGLGANPRVTVGGQPEQLEPGGGSTATGGRGFFARLDAASLRQAPIEVAFTFEFRGNRSLSLVPQAGDTVWRVQSPWPHPGFQGDFLPNERSVGPDGFTATYRVGNLALGRSLIAEDEPMMMTPVATQAPPNVVTERSNAQTPPPSAAAQVSLVQPVDAYGQVNRATKYGFLFIGFTFLAFLMFDLVGGVRVSAIEYLLVGVGLILFFVMLLAFAEVIGFMLAYVVASAAITGLITFYSASVLKSWRRGVFMALLLILLYAVLYVLLSLEAYSLLIGSVTLFVALAAIMYLTRGLNWGARQEVQG